jgi:hypothetical protein
MTGNAIIVAGIEIPSSNPAFLAVVGTHVLLGLARTITGIIAMLSAKRVAIIPPLANDANAGSLSAGPGAARKIQVRSVGF